MGVGVGVGVDAVGMGARDFTYPVDALEPEVGPRVRVVL